jgi:DNA polymerase-1
MTTTDEQTTLLIDGDTIAYMASAACQENVMDFDGFIKPLANAMQGETVVDNMILGLMRDLEAHGIMVFLSDPLANWRMELMPEYKAHRARAEGELDVRPMLLGHLKQYLRDKYGATHMPTLEADDLIGIMATNPNTDYPGRTVIVGKDKDFDTIPGLHHQLHRDINSNGKRFVRGVTPEFADWFHLVQTLAGDRVDGYIGCPGIGMTRAKDILTDPQLLSPEHGVVTRGIRKGQRTTKWVSSPAAGNLWGCVVSNYEKAGLTEKDALLTARMAHILRHADYNQTTGAITLWVPPKGITRRTSSEGK